MSTKRSKTELYEAALALKTESGYAGPLSTKLKIPDLEIAIRHMNDIIEGRQKVDSHPQYLPARKYNKTKAASEAPAAETKTQMPAPATAAVATPAVAAPAAAAPAAATTEKAKRPASTWQRFLREQCQKNEGLKYGEAMKRFSNKGSEADQKLYHDWCSAQAASA